MKPSEVKNERKPDYPLDKIFLNRWSPRAMSGEPITKDELFSLFEAARWTPSSSNGQPWHFLYALRDTPEFEKFFSLLVEFNQMWAKNAAALIIITSRNNFEKDEKRDDLHSFGAGSAFMSLALQASINKLVCHGMAGLNYKKAKLELNIPDNYTLEAMIAIGKEGDISLLHERMQKSEKPNERKQVKDFVAKGEFPKNWK